jgi:hypothetical protein
MLSELEKFIALFEELKGRVNNSPTTLAWLAEQKADVRRLSYLVGEAAEKIRKAQLQSAERHCVVPTGFITAWKEFEDRFAPSVSGVLESERKAGAEEFLARLKKIAERQHTDVQSLLEKVLSELESRRQPGDSFDPTRDNPAALIEEIFLTYRDVVDAEILSDESADKAIGAWRFFDKTLGIDHRAIYTRWKSIPDLLIPSHALRVNPRPVFELYNEAARCYVFGDKIAAICMCRALIEHILEKHYKIKEKGLDKKITFAEDRYTHFRKMNLHEKRKLANKIMHKYEKQGEVDDWVVVDLLKTIQAIVQHIPG